MSKTNDRVAAAVAEAVRTTKPKKQAQPCQCLSTVAYRVTAEDIPEADPVGFVEYDVYQSCGGETLREFLPGHDAKLKSVLIKRHLDDDDFAFLSDGGGILMHTSARQFAQGRGWEKFLDAAKEKQTRKIAAARSRQEARAEAKADKPAKEAKPKADKPDTTPAPAPVAGFHPVRFKIGRWVYDGNIEAEDVNELTVSYKNKKGATVTSTIRRIQVVA